MVCVFSAMLCGGCANKDGELVRETKKQELVLAVPQNCASVYKKLAYEFTQQNHSIDVRVMSMGDGCMDYYRKISSILAGNELEIDLAIAEDVWMDEFIRYGLLKPLDGIVQIDREDYTKPILDFITYEDQMYMLPLEQDVGVVFYLKESVKGTDWKDLSVHGLDDDEQMMNLLGLIGACDDIGEGLTLYKQLWNQTGQKTFINFKNAEVSKALSYSSRRRELYSEVCAIQGKAAYTLPETKSGKKTTYAKMTGLVMNQNSTKERAVSEFLAYMNREELRRNLIKDSLGIPVWNKQFEDALVQDYIPITKELQGNTDIIKYRRKCIDFVMNFEDALDAVNRYLEDDRFFEAAVDAVKKIL